MKKYEENMKEYEEVWRKYEEIWKNYEESMDKYEEVWRKYEEIWRNYEENMKEYEEIWRNYEGYMNKYEGIMKDLWNYMWEIWKSGLCLYMGRGTWKNFELNLLFRGEGGYGSQFPGLGVPQRKDMKHVNMKEYTEIRRKYEDNMKKKIWRNMKTIWRNMKELLSPYVDRWT